ncbi:MAG TPA: acyl-homoserine-lactone synthase [Herbaspirillum sp.]|jgi:acyl homoserine lactone synthase
MAKTDFFSGATKEWSTDIYSELLRYRYKVFVQKLGWNVPCSHGMEFDQFDREDTIHIGARDGAGSMRAYSRLLPTVKPYLLEEVFPQLMDGKSLPCSDDTWELSRFTAEDMRARSPASSGAHMSPMSKELLNQSIEEAANRGAKQIIFVASPGLTLLMKRADFNVHCIGRPRMVDGHPVVAASIKF